MMNAGYSTRNSTQISLSVFLSDSILGVLFREFEEQKQVTYTFEPFFKRGYD